MVSNGPFYFPSLTFLPPILGGFFLYVRVLFFPFLFSFYGFPSLSLSIPLPFSFSFPFPFPFLLFPFIFITFCSFFPSSSSIPFFFLFLNWYGLVHFRAAERYEAAGALAVNASSGTADTFWEYLQEGALITTLTNATRNLTATNWIKGQDHR